MRRLIARLSALVLVVAPARHAVAQDSAAVTGSQRQEIQRRLAQLRQDPNAIPLPPADSVTPGSRTIAAGTVVPGSVVVGHGPLHVYGTIDGNAVALQGDVFIHSGGVVRGDALAVLGRVVIDGGTVQGEMRALGGAVGAVPRAAVKSPVRKSLDSTKIAAGFLMLVLAIGLGVLGFASQHLDGVVAELETAVVRSFLWGLLAQIALLPGLLVLVVALAVTILGILLIPFAIVAYLIAAVGALTLGFLAAARVTGGALVRSPGGARVVALRSLVVGVAWYGVLWVIAAMLSGAPSAAIAVRIVALVLTWVATTAGLGAALRSRAGTRFVTATMPAAPAADEKAWQTPTPVSGVVAARRPTPPPVAAQGGDWR